MDNKDRVLWNTVLYDHDNLSTRSCRRWSWVRGYGFLWLVLTYATQFPDATSADARLDAALQLLLTVSMKLRDARPSMRSLASPTALYRLAISGCTRDASRSTVRYWCQLHTKGTSAET